MAESNLKDITSKLGILKDYSSLIVPMIITLVAVLLFVPGQIISSNLKKDMTEKSISERASKIGSSRKHVPSRQWEIERDYQQLYEDDAEQITEFSKQTSRGQLLSYNIFPSPKDESQMIFDNFGEHYREGIQSLLEHINAVDRPTDAELGGETAGDSTKSKDTKDKVRDMITDALCRSKAESGSIYANPLDIRGYGFWGMYEYTGIENAVMDCWYWQLGYWIVEDVIKTIDIMNFGSSKVYTSQVKRLMSINFTDAENSKRKAAIRSVAGEPYYVISDQDGLVKSFTKRYTNSDIDVVHFNVIVLVSTKAVLPFMDELCSSKKHKFGGFSGNEQIKSFKHNQITILRSSVESIAPGDEEHAFYSYGTEDEVIKLDLICEYIFNKSGCDEIKPASIKEYTQNLVEMALATSSETQTGGRGRGVRGRAVRGRGGR